MPRNTKMPTQEEKVMSALSHLGLLLPFWGFILAVTFWLTQREKSNYIRFQAMQAVVFQVAFYLVMIGWALIYVASLFIAFSILPFTGRQPIPLPFYLPIGVLGLALITFALFAGLAVYAVISTFQGKRFYYPILGRRLAGETNKRNKNNKRSTTSSKQNSAVKSIN